MQEETAKEYTQDLDRQQAALLHGAGRSVKRAIRKLRCIGLLLEAWQNGDNLTACLAALGEDEEVTPYEAVEDALGDCVLEVGDITGKLRDWSRLERIRIAKSNRKEGGSP